jgi:hypothetical protein
MLWVEENVKMSFKLPTLPQFTDHQRELYKEQVAARERKRRSKADEDVRNSDTASTSHKTKKDVSNGDSASASHTKAVASAKSGEKHEIVPKKSDNAPKRGSGIVYSSTVTRTTSSESFHSATHVSGHGSTGRMQMKSRRESKFFSKTTKTTGTLKRTFNRPPRGGGVGRDMTEL